MASNRFRTEKNGCIGSIRKKTRKGYSNNEITFSRDLKTCFNSITRVSRRQTTNSFVRSNKTFFFFLNSTRVLVWGTSVAKFARATLASSRPMVIIFVFIYFTLNFFLPPNAIRTIRTCTQQRRHSLILPLWYCSITSLILLRMQTSIFGSSRKHRSVDV